MVSRMSLSTASDVCTTIDRPAPCCCFTTSCTVKFDLDGDGDFNEPSVETLRDELSVIVKESVENDDVQTEERAIPADTYL